MRLIVLVLLTAYAIASAAQVYTWKDAEGRTHYSDQPPDGKPGSVKEIPFPAAGTTVPKPKAAPRDGPIGTDDAMAADTNPPRDPQSDCDKARADLRALYERPRPTAVGKGGKFVALDGDERATEEAELRKAIDANCR